MNDEHHEERPFRRLSRRKRFEVRRAVYNGSAVKDPALAAMAVAHARRLKTAHRRWFRSFLLDPFDATTYVIFSVVLLVVWPSLITVGILVGGFLLIALMTRRRRRRKADQAEAANQRLLQEPRHARET
jgi:Flp pilus assembly protein TadB